VFPCKHHKGRKAGLYRLVTFFDGNKTRDGDPKPKVDLDLAKTVGEDV